MEHTLIKDPGAIIKEKIHQDFGFVGGSSISKKSKLSIIISETSQLCHLGKIYMPLSTLHRFSITTLVDSLLLIHIEDLREKT